MQDMAAAVVSAEAPGVQPAAPAGLPEVLGGAAAEYAQLWAGLGSLYGLNLAIKSGLVQVGCSTTPHAVVD
jgi:hypothetical protein